MSHEPVQQGFDVLDAMVPPEAGVSRAGYRVVMSDEIAGLDWDELRAVCRALACDVTRVVTKAMDYQIARARRLRGARGAQNVEARRPRLGTDDGAQPAPAGETTGRSRRMSLRAQRSNLVLGRLRLLRRGAPRNDIRQGKVSPEGGGAPGSPAAPAGETTGRSRRMSLRAQRSNLVLGRLRLLRRGAPRNDIRQGKGTPEGGTAPCGTAPSGAGACCLCGRRFPIAGTRGPSRDHTLRRVWSAPARVRALVGERGITDKDAMLCRECRMDLVEATGLEKGRSGLDSSTKSPGSSLVARISSLGSRSEPCVSTSDEGRGTSDVLGLPPQSRPDLPFSKPADLLEGVSS